MGIRPDTALPPGDSPAGPLALKLCPVCASLLPLSAFYKQALRADGLSRACKQCKPQPVRQRTKSQKAADALYRRRTARPPLIRGPYKSKYNPKGLPLELLEGRIS